MLKWTLLQAAVLTLTLSSAVWAASPSWPQFRGPLGNGVTNSQHPVAWSGDKNVAWSADIDGGGWASPVVAGDRVFVTTAVSPEFKRPKGFGQGVASMGFFYLSRPPQKAISFEVRCLSLSNGKELWRTKIAAKKPSFKIHPSNSYATESPATDGNFVYTYFAAIGVVACVDMEGKVVWTKDLGAYPTSNNFGTGSSLAIDGSRVFVQCDNEEKSFVAAFDAKSGSEAWRVDRNGRTSWSSPVVWRNRVRTELVVCGAGDVTSYDPTSGKALWRLSGTGGAFSASPTFDAERIYFGNSGRNSRGPLTAVNAGAAGELTLDSVGPQGVAWSEKSAAPGMCSPVVADGRLYVLSRGILSCHEAATGKRLYRERLKNSNSVTASLWAAGDKIFALNESGDTNVVKVGDKFELIRSNKLPGLFWSTPSAADKSLLIRGAAKLHCIR